MAWDAKDIAELKARIPHDHRPSHEADGTLSNAFYAVDSLHESTALQGNGAQETELLRHNMGMAIAGNPDAAGASFILTGAAASAKYAHMVQEERKKRQKEERQLIDLLHDALVVRLAALDEELRIIDERLEEIRIRRTKIGDGMEALDELEKLRRERRLDANNKDHIRLLEAAGLTAQDAKTDDFASILATRRSVLNIEDGNLEAEWNERMKRRGQVVVEREAAADALGEIENANTDEARILAERRAATVLGAQQLGEAASLTNNEQAKFIAADAVAANELDELRKDSEAYNRSAAEIDAARIITTDDSGPKF